MQLDHTLPRGAAQFLVVALAFKMLLEKVPALKNRGNQVASDEYVIGKINLLQQLCKEAIYNSLKLAERNKVQAELRVLFKKFFHFLEAVGDDNDMAIVQEEGFPTRKPRKKRSSRKQVDNQ